MKQTPMPARSKPMRRTRMRSKPNSKRPRRGKVLNPRDNIQDLRNKVYDRAAGRCDLCGHPLSRSSFECHHRKKRSQGGLDEMANLVALHSGCHGDRVHGQPAWSYANGFLVRRNGDPAEEPLLRHGVHWQIPGEKQWHGAPAPSTDGGAA